MSMSDEGKQLKWFYQVTAGGSEQGPLDLVELAGLLRSGDISEETLIRKKDDSSWEPFRNRREFTWAKNMPLGVILRHLDEKDKAKAAESPLSFRKLYYFIVFLAGFGVYAFAYLGKLLYHAGFWLHSLGKALNLFQH
jgi:hypothetical protein